MVNFNEKNLDFVINAEEEKNWDKYKYNNKYKHKYTHYNNKHNYWYLAILISSADSFIVEYLVSKCFSKDNISTCQQPTLAAKS